MGTYILSQMGTYIFGSVYKLRKNAGLLHIIF